MPKPDPFWSPTAGELARLLLAVLRSDPDPQTKWGEARRQINREIANWPAASKGPHEKNQGHDADH
jgi:hypothetical protein